MHSDSHPVSGAETQIDLNADLGEGVTDDDGLLEVVTSANLACGFHAGDEATMRSVCTAAAARGVVVGAQVSYLDRENFGAPADGPGRRGARRVGPRTGGPADHDRRGVRDPGHPCRWLGTAWCVRCACTGTRPERSMPRAPYVQRCPGPGTPCGHGPGEKAPG